MELGVQVRYKRRKRMARLRCASQGRAIELEGWGLAP